MKTIKLSIAILMLGFFCSSLVWANPELKAQFHPQGFSIEFEQKDSSTLIVQNTEFDFVILDSNYVAGNFVSTSELPIGKYLVVYKNTNQKKRQSWVYEVKY